MTTCHPLGQLFGVYHRVPQVQKISASTVCLNIIVWWFALKNKVPQLWGVSHAKNLKISHFGWHLAIFEIKSNWNLSFLIALIIYHRKVPSISHPLILLLSWAKMNTFPSLILKQFLHIKYKIPGVLWFKNKKICVKQPKIYLSQSSEKIENLSQKCFKKIFFWIKIFSNLSQKCFKIFFLKHFEIEILSKNLTWKIYAEKH